MAASARGTTPTHIGSIAAAAPAAPDTPTSLASSTAAAAQATATATAPSEAPIARDSVKLAPIVAITDFRGSVSPKPLRVGLSPLASPIPLTGAAAAAEQREYNREKRKRSAEPSDYSSQQTSPNPGVAAVRSLLGTQMSSAKDAPPAVTNMSDPLEKAAKSLKIIGNGTTASDPAQTSPVSMSSIGSTLEQLTTAVTATAMDATAGPTNNDPLGEGAGRGAAPVAPAMQPQHQQQNSGSTSSTTNDAGLRAFSFPQPLDGDLRSTPNRGMSLPVPFNAQQQTPTTRSPSMSTGSGSSAKRHKCPYCSTDFTRHHNLKSHLLTHSQEKPYECKECNARFRRLHDLKRHTKLHTGERPHTCPKCGRRFARGDALARHNKGSGGCAGRRSSFGAPGEDGADGEGMDGLEYSTHQTEEPERMEEDEAMDDAGVRRQSEPSRDGPLRRAPTASTYPPIQGGPAGGVPRDAVRGMYPPPSGPSTAQSSYRAPSGPQPSQPGTSGSGSHGPSPLHFPPDSARSMFAQSSMTESPKPLSPGQEVHRGSLPGPYSNYSRQGSSNSAYPPPPNSNAPTLPSLPGLSGHAHPGPYPSIQPPPHGGPGSNPGSLSSHGASSGGSLREVLSGGVAGGAGSGPTEAKFRELEARMARMQDQYEERISSLQQEVAMLREHVRNTGVQPPPTQVGPPPGPSR